MYPRGDPPSAARTSESFSFVVSFVVSVCGASTATIPANVSAVTFSKTNDVRARLIASFGFATFAGWTTPT